MPTLILADHDNRSLAPSTACLVSAAQALGAPVTILVAGADCASVAEAAARLEGVARVLLAEHPAYAQALAEPLADLLTALAADHETVLASTGTTGKDVLPRAAALCASAQISEVVGIEAADVFVRAAYAGNALERVQSTQERNFLTVRATSFAPAAAGEPAPVARLDPSPRAPRAAFVGLEQSQSARPDLGAARVVVSGGRAFGSKERFESVLGPLADKLNAAIGASRAAVDAGYVSNDFQVGQTGKIVAPELYIACGISGAIQHMAGMKDSKVIVAINTDPESPIFEYADYGLVADIFSALPELTEKL